MNYRHEFHAGNFADVFKHIFLTRILLYLQIKPTAFRYIDTHAGSGAYDLGGEAAARTGEWRDGIARLLEANTRGEAAAPLAPYLALVRPYFKGRLYPGSPLIARDFLRLQDRMLLCELHPDAMERLKRHFPAKTGAKLIEIDAYTGLAAFVPPVERRGVVLIDPPFEAPQEFENLLAGLETAWRKWQSGIFMVWYPVKEFARLEAFLRGLRAHQIKRVLRLELQVKNIQKDSPLVRCGLLVINPPFTLEAEAKILLPAMLASMSEKAGGDYLIEWLSGE